MGIENFCGNFGDSFIFPFALFTHIIPTLHRKNNVVFKMSTKSSGKNILKLYDKEEIRWRKFLAELSKEKINTNEGTLKLVKKKLPAIHVLTQTTFPS